MFTAHVIDADDSGVVRSVEDIRAADVWINGGYFVFRREIFDYIRPGEELVEAPFQRLIEAGELIAYRYEGFWEPMDTIKDKQRLDALADSGQAPWRRSATLQDLEAASAG
jgi:glucose-1-phosphate cytidylyltransferase